MTTCTESLAARSSPTSRVHPPETKSTSGHDARPPLVGSLDPCLGRTGIPANELSQVFRHGGWAGHRRLVYDALKRTMRPVTRIASFADCGSQAYVLKSLGEPPVYRVAGSSCHDRMCTPCATERSRTVAQNVIDRMGSQRVRFITFTLRHSTDSLASLLDKLYDAFKRIQRTKLWRAHVTGGVAFLEVKYSDRVEGWHPHFHVLATGKYIDKRVLQSTWQTITADSFVVDIRLPGGKKNVAHYVAKYASKPLNRSFIHRPPLLDEAIVALKGRRLCTTFGGWRGVLLVDKPDEEAWENIGPLSAWLQRAVDGDDDALQVLHQVHAGRTDVCMELKPLFARPPPLARPTPTPPEPVLFLTDYPSDRMPF